MISQATVATANASKYLQQLSKHWSHRFTVAFDTNNSRIDFGDNEVVRLEADDETLRVAVDYQDESHIDELERVVADHLKRFAFREELDFQWIRSAEKA